IESERSFARPPPVDRSLAHTRALGHSLDRQVGQAGRRDDLARRLEDRFLRTPAPRPPSAPCLGNTFYRHLVSVYETRRSVMNAKEDSLMDKVKLGRSALEVSPIAFGTWQLGGDWGATDEQAAIAA